MAFPAATSRTLLLLMLMIVQGLGNTLEMGRPDLLPQVKRGTTIAQQSLTGIFALRKALVGSKHKRTKSITYRRYDKPGELTDALDDFYAFNPQDVTKFRGMSNRITLYLGKAGDKSLRLRVNGDEFSRRRPVLEVIEADTTKRPYITRINYTEY